MKKKLAITAGVLFALVVAVAILPPTVLQSMGLHPEFEASKQYALSGKKALVVTTKHIVLSKAGETTGAPTGVFGSEMTVPYYEFLDAGMEVDVASIQGGEMLVHSVGLYQKEKLDTLVQAR